MHAHVETAGLPDSTRMTRTVAQLTAWLGSFPAILGSVALVVVWALVGPIFDFSDTWQLVINTGTTIITFNMVFVIQNTQNRDGRAMQAKLDAQSLALHRIMGALELADEQQEDLDRLVGVEEADEQVIVREQRRVQARSSTAPAS
jgi:low affinity Fe/Cu permease